MSSIKDEKNLLTNEPTEYLAEFSYSVISKIINVVLGIAGIAVGIIQSTLFFRLLITIGGLAVFYYGFKELINAKAKLKLAKTGLWTKKLGFKPWSSIKMITIKFDKYPVRSSKDPTLNIYLKDNDTIWPDQELLFGALKNSEKIKPMIDELCGKDMKCEEVSR